MATPKEFLEVSEDDDWKPCFMCEGEIMQERKAFFKCLECGAEIVACEEDMRA